MSNWHSATSPPEREGMSRLSRDVIVLIGKYQRIDRYDHIAKAWENYRNVTHWHELPARPEQGELVL